MASSSSFATGIHEVSDWDIATRRYLEADYLRSNLARWATFGEGSSAARKDDEEQEDMGSHQREGDPVLIVDVAESAGCPKGSIEVRPGDSPAVLARQYAAKHNLNSVNEVRLTKALARAMAAHLQ